MAHKFTKFQSAWLKALESGKYRKTEGVLTNVYSGGSRGHCCLGVACVVGRKLGLDIRSEKSGANISYNGDRTNLTKDIQDMLGLRDDSGTFEDNVDAVIRGTRGEEYTASSLVDLNDEAHWTHKQIAAYIRKNPENVFVEA